MANDQGNEAGDRDGAKGAGGTRRLAAGPSGARQPRLPFAVVGMGASAGWRWRPARSTCGTSGACIW